MSSDDAQHDNYCKTCSRALTKMTNSAGEVSYFHDAVTATDDHEIVRVPLSQVENPVMFCDFCGASPPSWSYLADDVHLIYIDPSVGGTRIVTRQEADAYLKTRPGAMASS